MSSRVAKHGEVISQDVRSKVSMRYKAITKAVNSEFRNINNDTDYSLQVGSYGRGTAVDTSDIDILVELPEAEYNRFDHQKGNGQSRLLQAVRSAILATYPRTDVRADGQVVKVAFTDGMLFEVLPAFKNSLSNTYTYPDTNMGGNWRSTNPKAEIEAMQQKNRNSNGLFFDTCKHIRRIRDDNFSSYTLSGIVIDCFVYHAMGGWYWLNPGESSSNTITYEDVLLNYFNQNFVCSHNIQAPGSHGTVGASTSITCLSKVLEHMVK